MTHWKRLWRWEGLGARGEGDDRGWDGWMASLTRWTWVSVNSGCWRWTGKPGMLRFMGSQRVGHDWASDLIWSDPTLAGNFLTTILPGKFKFSLFLFSSVFMFQITIFISYKYPIVPVPLVDKTIMSLLNYIR